jgi:actin-like ATPase involved in cell morphogenesis
VIIKKEGHVVSNADSQARESYLRQRKIMEAKEDELDKVRATINNLTNEMSDIKAMLKLLLNQTPPEK